MARGYGERVCVFHGTVIVAATWLRLSRRPSSARREPALGLAAELLQDPVVRRRNRIALDWDGAWRLGTAGSDRLDREVIDVSVRFAAPIPVRPVRL
ncbi:DUF1062 domain-containing protein, partial [Streptomyces sp. NPDC054838]